MKTLAYTKALQYWVESMKSMILSEPHQLAGSILELRQAMEPLQSSKIQRSSATTLLHETMMSVTTVEPTPGGSFQCPIANDD